MVGAPDVVDLAHLLVADEGIDKLEESRDNNHRVWPIVVDDVEEACHDILAQALQVFEQGSLNALADASPAFDVKDRHENVLIGQRSNVDPVRGDDIETFQVVIRPAVQRQGDGNVRVAQKCRQ